MRSLADVDAVGHRLVLSFPPSTDQPVAGWVFVERHAAEVWRLAVGWTGSAALAAEVVELVWLRVQERLDVWLSGLDDDDSLRSAVLHDLIIGTAVEECTRARRLAIWREVAHARGA